MYTIKQLRKEKLWIRCTSIEQGRILGKYYYSKDNGKSNIWQNHDFNGMSEFIVYIGNEDNHPGGWNSINSNYKPDLEFSEIIFNSTYEIY